MKVLLSSILLHNFFCILNFACDFSNFNLYCIGRFYYIQPWVYYSRHGLPFLDNMTFVRGGGRELLGKVAAGLC